MLGIICNKLDQNEANRRRDEENRKKTEEENRIGDEENHKELMNKLNSLIEVSKSNQSRKNYDKNRVLSENDPEITYALKVISYLTE